MTKQGGNLTISVVIPIYNVLRYLKESVDSILLQSRAPNEIILVDDGSTDGSSQLLDRLYLGTPRVKILHTQNRGVGPARNEGVRAASGDYIVFLDSDDVAEPELIQHVCQAIETYPQADLVCYAGSPFADPGDPSLVVSPHLVSKWLRPWDRVVDTGREAINLFLEEDHYISNAWLYAVRRQVLLSNNLWFKTILYEDAEFTPRLFLKAGTTVVLSRLLVRYRIRSGSIMRSRLSIKNMESYLTILRTLARLGFSLGPDLRTRRNIQRLRRMSFFRLETLRKQCDELWSFRMVVGYWRFLARALIEKPLLLFHFIHPALFRLGMKALRRHRSVHEY